MLLLAWRPLPTVLALAAWIVGVIVTPMLIIAGPVAAHSDRADVFPPNATRMFFPAVLGSRP